jgi:DNA polymerase elongation subunit (family B)
MLKMNKPVNIGDHIPYVICIQGPEGSMAPQRARHPDEVVRSNGELTVRFSVMCTDFALRLRHHSRLRTAINRLSYLITHTTIFHRFSKKITDLYHSFHFLSHSLSLPLSLSSSLLPHSHQLPHPLHFHILFLMANPLSHFFAALQLDYEWYLGNQILPPISRLCEPIEGTSAAEMSARLGLDVSK